MTLRPYQADIYQAAREAMRTHRRVFIQLDCGGGKTMIFCEMGKNARAKNLVVWICLPRNELIEQSSETLGEMGVPHGRITASRTESRAFDLHLVSSNTLIRRWDKIKRKPDIIIIDEGHLFYDRQAEIMKRYPDAWIVAVSASPERLDGRGLGELYPVLVNGPPTAWLTERGYLMPFRMFSPPCVGLETVKRTGYEYDENELHELLERNKTYGRSVELYEKHARGKTTLAFARSVKAAHEVAHRFGAAGYTFEAISGKTPKRQRKILIDALRDQKIDGLVNCEIATYGLDVKPIECLIGLRPTTSRALYKQMCGRGSRPSPETGKTECVFLDQVGLYDEFRHPMDPYEWNFNGTKRRKREKDPEDRRLKLCPDLDFQYCDKPSCSGCEHNKTGKKSRAEEVVDCQLREVAPAVPLNDRPQEERREYIDRIGAARKACRDGLDAGEIPKGPIADLLNLYAATGVKNAAMKCYYELNTLRFAVNVPLLAEIARCKNYKPFWTKMKTDDLRRKLPRKPADSLFG
jgi:superfamily II DNA or RNA helicase